MKISYAAVILAFILFLQGCGSVAKIQMDDTDPVILTATANGPSDLEIESYYKIHAEWRGYDGSSYRNYSRIEFKSNNNEDLLVTSFCNGQRIFKRNAIGSSDKYSCTRITATVQVINSELERIITITPISMSQDKRTLLNGGFGRPKAPDTTMQQWRDWIAHQYEKTIEKTRRQNAERQRQDAERVQRLEQERLTRERRQAYTDSKINEFQINARQPKEVGTMICHSDNRFGYVERIENDRIQIRLTGRAETGQRYIWFLQPNNKHRTVLLNQIIWDVHSNWSPCDLN